jgi:hypothetical protein
MKVAGQINLPAGAPHQGRFNEIVAQDRAAERLFAGQLGESAMFDERANPDDRFG